MTDTTTEAPGTIWARPDPYEPDWTGDKALRSKIHVEYRRADLPPTLSAALKLPEVVALVAELKTARYSLAPMPSDNPMMAQAKRQRLAKIAAVLAPFEGIEP